MGRAEKKRELASGLNRQCVAGRLSLNGVIPRTTIVLTPSQAFCLLTFDIA